jgi:hypothetical protein
MAEKSTTELDVWTGVIAPENGNMPPDHARAVLQWQFNDAAKRQMNQLADRNNSGELSASEREELEAYVHVGQVIAVLQAKARLSLKQASLNGDD